MAKEIRGDIQGLRAVAVAVVICAHAGSRGPARRVRRRRRLLRDLRLPDHRAAVPRGPGHRRALDRRSSGPAAPGASCPRRPWSPSPPCSARCWSWASWTPARSSSTRSGPRRSPPTSTSPSRASTTSPRTPGPRRCSTTGRSRWRSSSTSSGRSRCSGYSCSPGSSPAASPSGFRAVRCWGCCWPSSSARSPGRSTQTVPPRPPPTSRPSPGPGSSASVPWSRWSRPRRSPASGTATLELAAFVGVVAVVASCVLITSATPFPGVAAALPVGGTALVLLAGRGSATTLVGAAAVDRAVPRRSATGPTRSTSGTGRCWSSPSTPWAAALTAFESGLAVLVTLTLSAYSYRYVEMPFRNGRPAHRLPRRRALALYPVSAVLVLAVGGGAWLWTGAQATERAATTRRSPSPARDKPGRSTSTPSRWCGPRSTPHATGRPSPARPTPASWTCATAWPTSASATTSTTSASSARPARTTATGPWCSSATRTPAPGSRRSTASPRRAAGRPTTWSSPSAPRRTSRSPRRSPTTRSSPTARTSRTG